MNDSSSGRLSYNFDTFSYLLVDCRSGLEALRAGCITATISGIFCAFISPFLACLSFFGNGLTGYLALFKWRPLTRQNAFYGCVALVDCVTVPLLGMLHGFLNRGLPWISGGRLGFLLSNRGEIGCKAHWIIGSLCQLLPAMLLLVMVTDRLLAFLMPMRLQQVGSGIAFRSVLAATLVTLGLTVPRLLLVTRYAIFDGVGFFSIVCYFAPSQHNFALTYDTLFISPPTIPLLLVLLCNVALLIRIARLAAKRRHLSNNTATESVDRQSLSSATIVMAMSCVTLGFNLPLLAVEWAVQLVTKYTADRQAGIRTARMLSNFIFSLKQLAMMTGQAVNWIILMARCKKYRQAVREMMPW